MVASVNYYGGFYVGRYEVSINENKAQSKRDIVSASSEERSAGTWYGLYALCKTYKANSVKSNMICGSQYNAMLTWMGTDITNFDVNDRNTTTKTGTVEKDKIKNVYDLGGCKHEWTLTAVSSSLRVAYGGCRYDDDLPGDELSTVPTNSVDDFGSRLALYIEL